MRYRRLNYRYAVLVAGQPSAARRELAAGTWRVLIAEPSWRPAADVYESAAEIQITVELAGIEPDELDVLLYENAVVVEGRRRLAAPDAAGVYQAAEIRQGPFRLEVPLPAAIDPERVEAGYEQGLLRLSLAKAEGR